MPTKQEILDGIEDFDAKSLAQFIKQGVVTLEELKSDPEVFPRKKQKEVAEWLKAEEKQFAEAALTGGIEECNQYISMYPQGEEYQAIANRLEKLQHNALEHEQSIAQLADWESAKTANSVEGYRAFLHCYPGSPYQAEAQEQINALVDETIKGPRFEQLLDFLRNPHNQFYATERIQADLESGAVDRNALLEYLRRDPNLIGSGCMRELISYGIYSYEDLLNSGMERKVLQALRNDNVELISFAYKEPPTVLQTPYTEVFFWGIPSSGKTCALGALISTAEQRGMEKLECQGYDYMNRLSNVFRKDEINALPGSTPTTAIYEMCFNLQDANKRQHPLSFIDLAGELFRALYKDLAGDITPDLVEPFDALVSILRSQRTINRKMHLFVLEYGGHEKLLDGIRQDQYLNSAATWLSKRGIFDKDTDAIYILVTKSDLACPNGEDIQEELGKYIKRHYHGFYKTMRQLCEKYDINGGELEIIPFSVGDVYFQDFCRFDDESASAVLDTILDNSAKHDRKGVWGGILNFFKG